MKIVITEQQFKRVIKDEEIVEDYPTSWDINHFKSLTSFNSRIKYCEENLTRISSGSARIVYRIDDEKVLKLARNKKGLAQNEAENSFGGEYLLQDVVADVFESEENGLWVEMELARKVSVGDFKRITGLDFDMFSEGVYTYGDGHYGNKKTIYGGASKEVMDELWENEFAIEIFSYIGSYDVQYADLAKLNSYGVVKRDGQEIVVIIDFGLSQDVFNTHYSR